MSSVTLSFDIGIKNLSCCAMSLKEDSCDILFWGLLPLLDEGVKVKKLVMENLALSLFDKLDELMTKIKDVNIDNVLIESQPCMKNPQMKTIQVMVYSYFTLKKHQMGNVEKIHLVFAGSKNIADFHENKVLPEQPKPNMKPYDIRKWQSIEYTKLYILGNDDLTKYFNSYKKKDDLSDTFTQACVWHKRNKLFPNAFDKINMLI